ncbi:hypothetical protein TNCV_4624711 [Trichonephila clavipes]|nr:hypothetical protein TNCV_4624711 [Trichonephila clavipes]
MHFLSSFLRLFVIPTTRFLERENDRFRERFRGRELFLRSGVLLSFIVRSSILLCSLSISWRIRFSLDEAMAFVESETVGVLTSRILSATSGFLDGYWRDGCQDSLHLRSVAAEEKVPT